MKNWQRKRNYRTIKVDGRVTAYLITVDGQDVEVTEEVYQAYSRMDRQERYQAERDESAGLLFEADIDDRSKALRSAMRCALENARRRREYASLRKCLAQLEREERQLLLWRYWEELPQGEIARRLGISQQAVSCREVRIRKKLKNIFEKI